MLEIRQFVPQSRCLNCKMCCRFTDSNSPWQPVVLKDEVNDVLQDSLYHDALLPSGRIKTAAYNQGFLCLFFDLKNNRCRIYGDRPFECRLYPFLINKQSNRIYLSVDSNCPFIAEKLTSDEFRDYLEYLKRFLTLPDNFRKIKENFDIFAEYKSDNTINFFPLDDK